MSADDVATSTTSSAARREQDLLGQTVVVIGGSSGIGLETARLARAKGADLILTARNPDRLHRVCLELKGAGQWSSATPARPVIGFCSVDANDRQQPHATSHPGPGPLRDRPLEHRVAQVDYDAELRLHDEVLRRTYNLRADDRVLDIGCGTGRTTRDAARSAGEGSALGVDLSASMIERARELARAESVHNVAFEQGDAQVHRFPEDGFDLAISRFGTMFFDDPVAAFANIAVALRPAGRLVMMVWQEHEHNEWSVAIERALGREGSPVPAPEAREPFSLADQDTVEAILGAAGFGEATFTDVHQPIYFGPDVAAALEWVGGFSSTRGLLTRLGAAAAERALERLREALATHASERGVWFDSRAWIIEASRR